MEVVGLCAVDSKMVETGAELVAARQPFKKKSPVFGDYRKLLAEQRPEVVLIGTPTAFELCPGPKKWRAPGRRY